MAKKIQIDDKEYLLEDLSTQAQNTLSSMDFVNGRIQELNNLRALLMRAKNSYISGLKSEVLSNKAGLHFDD
jgi:hypothetical protein